MYQMNDKKAAVREIQTYLYWLAVSGEYPIPQVIPNGEYGPQTAEGVLVFQKRCGIEETGAVDRATFDALYREYRRVRAQIAAKERGNFPDESEFPIGIGRSGSEVEELHILLCELARYYRDLEIERGGTFTETTAENVRRMQRHTACEPTGSVDPAFFDRLRLELRARKAIEKYAGVI